MRPTDWMRASLLRWDRVALVLALALPFGVASILGFLWLHERGWLWWFALGTAGFYASLRLLLFVARWAARRSRDAPAPRNLRSPEADPDWSEAERAAYQRARARIAQRLKAPIPWAELPAEALVTVESVAADLSGGTRSALDFTVPEALLLIDRVALRYRAFLLTHVPYSDRLSVRTMHWLWRNQDTALTAWETGFLAWRGVRLILNPAVALLREAERVLATGLQSRLTEGFRRDTQAILLEEAALAAVDLYSGRLIFTESDLAHRNLGAPVALGPPEAPVQIILVGQTGAGKSTLINALLGRDVAESDSAPTTDSVSAHELAPGVHLVDTPGLDGSDAQRRRTLTQMLRADMVLWVHRANRPGRAADADLARDYAQALAAEPGRRIAPLIHVVNAADLLVAEWPRAGTALSPSDYSMLAAAAVSIGERVSGAPGPVLTVRALDPPWHLDTLHAAIDAALPEARMTRRNRLRTEAARSVGLRGNLTRASRGIGATLRTFLHRGKK